MPNETLQSELKAIIAGLLEIPDFQPQDHFIRDLGADSMLIEQVVVAIETRYRIQLPNSELSKVRCLTDLVRVVAPRIAAAP
jgi:acyl carrier protein